MNRPDQTPKASTGSSATSEKGMRGARWSYLLAVFLVFLLIILSGRLNPSPETDILFAVSCQLMLLLTYPVGAIGSLCAMALIYLGIATPKEAFVVAAPVFAIAGYMQWCVFLPRLFRRGYIRTRD